jgi:hypothetical protein
MADNVVDIKVKVNTETGELDVLGAKFKGAAAGAKEAQGAFTGLTGEAKSLLSSLGLLATAGGVISFFTSSIKGAEEQNEAFRRLKFTLESSGESWANNENRIRSWTDAIGSSTRYSDGEAIETLEKLTRITGSLSQAQTASVLAMGMAKAGHIQLGEATGMLTDLLNGNERALKEVARVFGDVAGGAKTTQEAIDLLADKYQNAAFQNDGLTDATKQLSNTFGQFKDTVGNAVAGPLTKLVGWARDVVISIDQVGLRIATTAAKIQAFAEFAATPLSPGAAWADLKTRLNEINEEAGRQYAEIENKKTAVLDHAETQRLVITSAARDKAAVEAKKDRDKDLKDEAEANAKYKKLMEERTKADIVRIHAKSAADKVTQKTTIDDTLETFAILNTLGNQHTEGELARARVILAIEKAIAIARIWSGAAKFGPAMQAMAVAQTGLVIAQFAQQSQALGQAQREFSGQSSTSVSTPIDDGTGREIIQTGGAPVRAGGGGGGGGGGGAVITQHFSFSINFDQLTAENIRPFARAIGGCDPQQSNRCRSDGYRSQQRRREECRDRVMTTEPKLYSKNAIDDDSEFTVSSGSTVIANIFDRDSESQWESSGEDDDANAIEIIVEFPEARDIDTAMVINHNLSDITIQYWTGAAWASWSNELSVVDDFTKLTGTKRSTTKMRLTASATQTADEEKAIGELIYCSLALDFGRDFKSYEVGAREKVSLNTLGDGTIHQVMTLFSTNRTQKYECRFQIQYLSVDNLEIYQSLKEVGDPLIWQPESVSRPDQVFLVYIQGPVRWAYSEFKGAGVTLNGDLREV